MIRAELFAGEGGYCTGREFVESRVFGTERAAELWARSVLPVTVTTNDCYWRDVGRSASVYLFTDIGRAADNRVGRKVRRIDPEVRIVPSVGELGWTP